MAEDEVTRRLTTIAAADIAGYSRLVSKDEEGTLSALRSHRAELIDPIISGFHGRIANTAGDSLLIEFPSVVEALRCCTEIQRSMAERNADIPEDRRIEFRIGINVGDVIEQDGDLLGAGVNVAARLEGLAEPGGICISRAARDQVRDHLDVMLEDLGEVEVKNIDRPVRTFRVLAEGAAVSPRPGNIRSHWPMAAALIVVAAVILGGLSWWRPWIERVSNPLPQSLSIVVLPFDNLSADPEQSYFADAITEDLINDLSRIRGAFVIARGTSFTFKGMAMDTKKVASELKVRYVLEGSVRRAGDSVRVNAQLVDGTTGAHIWSDRFDRKYIDAFSLQNDITGRIAATLKGELLEAQSRGLKNGPPANLTAWDYALQGTVVLHQLENTNRLGEAKSLFEKALELDPDLASAWIGLARIHLVAFRREVSGISVPHSNKFSLEAAQKAVLLDRKSSDAFNILGLAYRAVDQIEEALATCETAVELNPNNSDAYLCLGTAKMYSGKGNPTDAIPLFKKSLQLNPRYRPFLPYMYMGQAYSLLERYEESVKAFSKSVSESPNNTVVLRGLASALAKIGRVDEARVVLVKYVKLSHGKRDTIEKLRAYFKLLSDAEFERLYGGLRQAGMPEK
jgi:adenylate cyclase